MRSVVGTSCHFTTQANELHVISPRSRSLLFGKRDVYVSALSEEPFAVIQTVRYPSLHGPLSCKRPLSYFCLRAPDGITVTYSWRSLCIFHPLPKFYYSKAEMIEIRALCDSTPPNSGTNYVSSKQLASKLALRLKEWGNLGLGAKTCRNSNSLLSLSHKDLLFSEVLEKELLTLCSFKNIRPFTLVRP